MPMLPQLKDFANNGFAVIPSAISPQACKDIHQLALENLSNPTDPYELESKLGYPGAPKPSSEKAQVAIRRFLNAYSRHPLYRDWAHKPELLNHIGALFENKPISLTQCHHNCIMTKLPKLSSDTAWHQDIRWWNFEDNHLINAWLSITEESISNGCLQVIPGSHKRDFSMEQFDHQKFFREDLVENQTLINSAKAIESKPGDLLLFDARLLHRAERNHTDTTKVSLVFTYKLQSNKALAHTRSSSMKEIDLNTETPKHRGLNT